MNEENRDDLDPDTRAVFDVMGKMLRQCKAGKLPADRFMPLITGFFNAWNLAQMMDDLGHQHLVRVAYTQAFEEECPECLYDFAEDFFVKLADEYVRAVSENLEEYKASRGGKLQ